MTNERIIEAIEESNKWWKGDFELEFKPREAYWNIKKFLKNKQIIALTGLRRVGKTTILLKIVKDSIREFNAKNILYFSFDDFREVRIKEVINIYARIMDKNFDKGNYLFLFDEIQKIDNWEEQLKRIYDNFKNIKIVISGSESLFIRKKSRESLTGRFFEFRIKPLNFKEYLEFKGKKFENLKLYKEEILKEFKNFLLCSGFPEIINEDELTIKKYIKENIIEKIIYKDIPQIFPIKEPAIIEDIYKIILLEPGQIINIDRLSKTLNISRQTVSLYLDYLEKSFLIKKLYNFSKNIRKTQMKLKKYYPTIISPEISNKLELKGKIFETALVLSLDAEFFWRDVYKNEIDIIKILEDDKILPVEIKYSNFDTKALKIFMRKFKLKEGIIITYDKESEISLNSKIVKIIPFYNYILE